MAAASHAPLRLYLYIQLYNFSIPRPNYRMGYLSACNLRVAIVHVQLSMSQWRIQAPEFQWFQMKTPFGLCLIKRSDQLSQLNEL